MDSETHHRRIRSFVRREGRFTPGQQHALQSLWPEFGIDAKGILDLSAEFNRTAPCTLEIGFGNGDNLASLAATETEQNFLGIEVHRPGVGRLLKTLKEQELSNVRVICEDAVTILERHLAPGSLDRVLILFPDPWHKKRHHKRRLIRQEFLDLLASRLVAGGTLHVATDWADYANEVLGLLGSHPAFTNRSPGGGFAPRPGYRILTRFERRGLRLGYTVHDLLFTRL